MKKNYIVLNLSALLLSFTSLRVMAQCTTVASVPYNESFSSITTNNQLPLCWAASNMSNTCLTYTNTGFTLKCAAFFNSPAGDNYFYGGSINLIPGISYSISIWYITDNTSGQNWTGLSLLLGPNQSTVGLNPLVSAPGVISTSIWKNLSTTFTVSTAGVYYVAVKGTATSGISPYLYWDDLSVTAPCAAGNNAPTATIAISPVITPTCSGQNFTISTIGVISNAHTYTWSNTSNSTTTTYNLAGSANVWVVATNTLTGCNTTVTIPVNITQSPNMSITTSTNQVCTGQSLTLSTPGNQADSYLWSTGMITQNIIISPTTTSNYTVTGTTTGGCSGTATINIVVNPLPTLTINSGTICSGRSALLKVSGTNSFLWNLGSGSLNSLDTVRVKPATTTIYTVSGTDSKGCTKTETLSLTVDACTGLSSALKNQTEIRVYPNPVKDQLIIKNESGAEIKKISITNNLGQVVFVLKEAESEEIIGLGFLQNGIYYLKVENGKGQKVFKIIKE